MGRKGLSLMEVMVSLGVIGSTALLYVSTFTQQVSMNDVNQEVEVGTVLLLQQIELLRSRNLINDPAGPYVEPDFNSDCVPYRYTENGPGDLDVGLPAAMTPDIFLTNADAISIPDGSPWKLVLDPALVQEGYVLTVHLRRVFFPVGDVGSRLVKATIRVGNLRNAGGPVPRNIITEDIYIEVRQPGELRP